MAALYLLHVFATVIYFTFEVIILYHFPPVLTSAAPQSSRALLPGLEPVSPVMVEWPHSGYSAFNSKETHALRPGGLTVRRLKHIICFLLQESL